MTDIKSASARSRNMASVRSTNTKPEIYIRSLLHRRGIRYRLHVKDLPGKPDIVLRKYSAVIFVNGCFWHGHDCHLFKWPEQNGRFWREKIEANRRRDDEAQATLLLNGWRISNIWECAIKGKSKEKPENLIEEILSWLTSEQTFLNLRG